MTRSQKIPSTPLPWTCWLNGVLTSSERSVSSVSALTLHGDQMTTSRRVSPVPQLKCIGRACRSYQPPTVQCVPIGSSGENDVQWKCEADLPKGYRFGSVEVGCEGWGACSSACWDYVCVTTKTLAHLAIRHRRLVGPVHPEGKLRLDVQPRQDRRVRGELVPRPSEPHLQYLCVKKGDFSTLARTDCVLALPAWPALALGALALYLLFQALRPRFPARFPSWNDARRWGGSWGGGPGGGGPGFGGGGPPPPYSSKPPGTDAAWQPGFWTGLAAGAAALQGANYLRGDGRRQQQQRQGWGVRDDDDRGVGGSGSWGRPATGNGGGGGMRPSTGFGGTRNR